MGSYSLKFKYISGIADHDGEGRLLVAEYENFYVINTYIPNSGRGLKDLDYRMKWDADFLAFVKKLDSTKPIVWCGDLNVSLFYMPLIIRTGCPP
jgi:exonuclease III